MTTPTAVETYFDAWRTNQPHRLSAVLARDVVVHGPLGRIDGAEQYQSSLGRIFGLTRELAILRRWVDGDDVLTWFDLHPHGDAAPFPVASWIRLDEDGLIASVDVTFDLTKLLDAGDPRRTTEGDH